MKPTTSALDLLTDVLAKAVANGADAADAVYVDGKSLSLTYRLGKREQLERSESTDLGLRVFIGKRQAVVSSSDLSAEALTGLVDRAVAMARVVPEDPYCGLAEPADLATEAIDVDGCDTVEPTVEMLLERAARAEDAARAVSGVTNSEGAETGWGVSYHAIAATNGFARAYSRSRHSLVVSVLAGEGTAMERDYDYTSAVHGEDLCDAAEIGRSAGEKAVGRLHPRKVASAQVPVIYEPRVAASLLGHLSAAINGAAVARGTTFLKDKLDTAIFPGSVNVIDDPLRRRGPRSRPFDAEGIATRRLKIIDAGVLRGWFLDLRSARQLGLATTGHAARGISSPPSPSTTNLYLEPGNVTPKQLLSEVKSGLYVTELIGFGVNGGTGDYSRGAGGYWIEDGRLAYPVSEVTIAGNLLQMFANVTVANDLEFRYGTDAPTLRVDGMTVAGR
jgi:PmbA protein